MLIRVALAGSLAFAMLATPLHAQEVPSGDVLLSARSAIGGLPIAGVRVSPDTVQITFTDATLTSGAIEAQTWTLGRDAGDAVRTPKQVGFDVARALWDGWARAAAAKVIVVELQAATPTTDAAKVRFFYYAAELRRR